MGYAQFAEELAQQERVLGVFFDCVIVATCTGSTQGGMLAGFAAQARARKLIGIDTAAAPEATWAAVARSARATAETIGVAPEIGDSDIIVNGDFTGPAYGIPDRATLDAIRLGGRLEGMLTDPVYEGKSLAGLIGLAGKRRLGALEQGVVCPPGRQSRAGRLPCRLCGCCGRPERNAGPAFASLNGGRAFVSRLVFP